MSHLQHVSARIDKIKLSMKVPSFMSMNFNICVDGSKGQSYENGSFKKLSHKQVLVEKDKH